MYGIKNDKKTLYNPARYIFPILKGKAMYISNSLLDLALTLTPLISYRKSSGVINRVRNQANNNGTNSRTLCNIIEKQGQLIKKNIEEKVDAIFKKHQVVINDNVVDVNKRKEFELKETVPADVVDQAVEKYNSDKKDHLKITDEKCFENYENPSKEYLQISADDVLVKHQKDENRKTNSPPPEKRSYVKNSIGHVQFGNKKYRLNTFSIDNLFKYILAFVLNSQLYISDYIVFYADGAQDIKCAIRKYFDWIKYKLILDWHHLDQKCKQRLSSGIKNKDLKEKILIYVTSQLWLGKVDEAISYLHNLDKEVIKSDYAIKKLIEYFEKNKEHIPCYALRKELGLRISSNPVEKANDLLVANRQKDNNTSWSKYGSVALTTVTTLNFNNEKDKWLKNRNISFEFSSEEVA